MLSLKGRILTADAMHTQRTTAETVCEAGGDYVLALMRNQQELYTDVSLFLDDSVAAQNSDSFQTVDADHGRIEIRHATVCRDINWLQERHNRPGLKANGKITAQRENAGKTTCQTRYYVMSKEWAAETFLHTARAYWAIENSLHWVLDVTMNEDAARTRKGRGPANLAILRRIALNLARMEPSKGSMRCKFKRAGWHDEYMLDLIRAAKPV